MRPGTIHSDSTLKTSRRSPSTLATWYCGSSTPMETFSLKSLYIAVFVLCVFISTVLYICCKLIRQDSRIDSLYQPQVIRPVALERPHRPMAKLRKPKNNRNFTSKGSQTAPVNSLHAAFQKSSVSTQNPLSENSEDEIKIESVQLFTASPDFYEDPSAAYESVCDIVRPSVIYSRVHRWFRMSGSESDLELIEIQEYLEYLSKLKRPLRRPVVPNPNWFLCGHCKWILKATDLKYVKVFGCRENQGPVLWSKIFWQEDSPTHHSFWWSYCLVLLTKKTHQLGNWVLLPLVPV